MEVAMERHLEHQRSEQEIKARVWAKVQERIALEDDAENGRQTFTIAPPAGMRRPIGKYRIDASGRLMGIVAALLLVGLMSVGCMKVKLPGSDSTPPVLKWSVIPVSGPTQTITGSGTINAAIGDTFDVTLTATDQQGIHEISLASSVSWTCVSDGANQTAGPGLAAPSVQTLFPDGQGNVLTSIFLMRDVNMGPFECQAGYRLGAVTVILYGKGENYFNGVTEATLTFKAP
jgi:hypothetical protein